MHIFLHSSMIYRVLGAIVCAVLLSCRFASAQVADEEFEGWHLEPGVGQAHLVMVARVASISQVTIVEGAKTDLALREYRFQPVRRLKGIFSRDQLSMTGADLGLTTEDATSTPLKEGQFRLLILVQQAGIQTYGCVAAAPGATTFAQRVPLVTGPDDALVGAVETLIEVADSRSRRQRAELLSKRLANTSDLAAVPLLTSFRLRADWAIADSVYAPRKPSPGNGPAPSLIEFLINDRQPAVQSAALALLRDMLANRITPDDAQGRKSLGTALGKIVASDLANTRVRLTALEALGHLLALDADIEGVRELLIGQLSGAATYVERTAAARALSRIKHPEAIAALQEALMGLPLDESPEREAVYARAAVRLDAAGAERVLLARLERSINARQSLQSEIEPLGRMRSKESLPLLLAAAVQLDLAAVDRQCIARALARLRDDRAVPVLAGWLRDYQTKEFALAALENIDSEAAAREVRPMLKTEGNLATKLRIARLLARHDIADGYALATEHLADVGHTASATLVLAALDDPRTASDLTSILAARPDRRWHGAVLSGLVAIGNAAAQRELLEILSDDRHPLAADAAEAAGLAADSELLAPLPKLVQSRNKQIARASLLALRRFLSGVRSSPRGLAAVDIFSGDDTEADGAELPRAAAEVPAKTRAAIIEAVASLVGDAYVESDVRQDAFAVARLLRGERFAQLLEDVADQAELEGSQLLASVQTELRRQRGVDN